MAIGGPVLGSGNLPAPISLPGLSRPPEGAGKEAADYTQPLRGRKGGRTPTQGSESRLTRRRVQE
jgi:hypothetical protein